LNKLPRSRSGRRISKISPTRNLIYDLKVENKQLRDENKSLNDRLSDLSQTLQTNKEMLTNIADKMNGLSHK